jgi:hypothetical protein
MANLSTADLNLIDRLFGMYGGKVLEFSIPRFRSFFERDVGVDIWDDVYLKYGTSKGKRLWGFMELGQRAAIVRALHALWEVRESERTGPDDVPDARERLSAVIEKLGGRPIAAPPGSARPPAPKPARPDDAALDQLEKDFLDLHGMTDRPQARGFAFEKFLQAWFDAWGMDARGSFRAEGEQVDGSFQHGGSTYLVEAKWHSAATDAATLHSFQGKLEERPQWTRGLFVSFEGFTQQGLSAFTARRVILMDGSDIYLALRDRIDLDKLIEAKARHASEKREPFARVSALFPAKA